jgi:hypothetical protein
MDKRPITFRPTDEDLRVLETIRKDHPVMGAKPQDLIRIALQEYMRSHRELRDMIARVYSFLNSQEGD